MEGLVLQPWITTRCQASAGSGVTSLVQDEEDWMDVGAFADAQLQVDVADVTAPSGSSVVLALRTSPTPDELLFRDVTGPLTLAAASTPKLARTIRSRLTAPLARLLRWEIRLEGGGSGAWGATFRIRVIPGRSSFFYPTDIDGLVLWLRSDQGVTLGGGGGVTSWADLSHAGNTASAPSGQEPGYSATGGVLGYPKITQTGTQVLTGTFAASVTAHTLFAVVTYPGALANRAAFAGTNAGGGVNTSFSQFMESPTGIIGRVSSSGGSNSDAVTTDTTSLGSPGVYCTGADASNVDLYVNGVLKATTAIGAAQGAAASFSVMGLSPTPAYPLGGDAYEFVLFNRLLATSERIQVHRYLGRRYGITVP